MAKLTTIEGIGEVTANKLKAAGVGSVESFLKTACSAKGRKQLAAATGMDASVILKFANHADLMRIKGIGGEYSELLEAAGVDTVAELKNRNSANLHAKMAEINASKKLVRQLASAAQVQGWVDQAKKLEKVITH